MKAIIVLKKCILTALIACFVLCTVAGCGKADKNLNAFEDEEEIESEDTEDTEKNNKSEDTEKLNESDESENIDQADDFIDTDKIEEAEKSETEISNDSEYLNIYRDWLNDFIEGNTGLDGGSDIILYSDYVDEWYFALKDINDDGVPELLLSGSYEKGINYSGEDMGEYLGYMSWYPLTIVEGSCQRLLYYGNSIVCYDHDKKNIYYYSLSEIGTSFGMDHAQNGDVVSIDRFDWYDSDDETESLYDRNDEPCAEEDFYAARNQCIDVAKKYPFEAIKLTSENIERL